MQSSTIIPEDDFTNTWLLSAIRREELALRYAVNQFKVQVAVFCVKSRHQQREKMSLLASNTQALKSAVSKPIASLLLRAKDTITKKEKLNSSLRATIEMGIVSAVSVEDTTKAAMIVETPNNILPNLEKRYLQARQQPKSPSEEMKLQAKYAAIESVEDRAFQILLDLGMIQKTNN